MDRPHDHGAPDPQAPPDLHVPASIHPELAAHTDLYLPPRLHQVGERVHCAVGWNLANITMIEGDDGIVIVDTGMNVQQGVDVLAEFRRITDKPIAAIVLTHHHVDHVQGTTSFVDVDRAGAGAVPIYAHESLMDEYSQENVLIGPIMNARAIPMYNLALSGEDAEGGNAGIGPVFGPGRSGFVQPTHTFGHDLEVTIAGIRMHMVHVPSEAESELCVWLPDQRVLLSAEVIQDHTCPNLYTLRGAKYRDPKQWYQSIDLMRQWGEAEHMVLQHGPPVSGGDEVADTLRNYRDGIQYQHDQTLRWANRGLAKDEIAQRVRLPEHLESWSPWMRPFDGSVKHNVPAIYNGYLGWFDGDPVALDPTPRRDYADRLVGLMGGRDAVLAEARRSYGDGDWQFTAELTTYLLRIDVDDTEARLLKAAAFRHLGYAQINPTWRGFYLTGALYLEGTLTDALDLMFQFLGQARGTPEVAGALTARTLVEQLPVRLRAEDTTDLHLTVELAFTDVDETFTVEIRRGVAETRQDRDATARRRSPIDASIAGPRTALGPLLLGAVAVAAGLDHPDLVLTGERADLVRFFSAFEDVFSAYPPFFLR
ncbi:MAG: alkyl sulfatase dimerization domain-containing protein [Acidimicrobiales bacterium]